ncbi:hypothetical protein [Nannocystis punicea]|uniref:Uncharacterized protein n=1 Tax=Nannocystis punicea TaxID=2995304 RepID=A0ABY7HBE8_9BACT|nr:hypothetical protein [Nannocystis poenicansa]WAS96599.1 hypothetical protein O0S08_10615 [Nannocystis poenicansa]
MHIPTEAVAEPVEPAGEGHLAAMGRRVFVSASEPIADLQCRYQRH